MKENLFEIKLTIQLHRLLLDFLSMALLNRMMYRSMLLLAFEEQRLSVV